MPNSAGVATTEDIVKRAIEAEGIRLADNDIWEVRVTRGPLGWAIASDETVRAVRSLVRAGDVVMTETGHPKFVS